MAAGYEESGGAMKPSEVLLAAAARLVRKDGWSQGQYARTKNGVPTPMVDDSAHSWCVVGSMCRTAGWPNIMEPERYLREVIGANGDISKWNDTPGRTQLEVVEACVRAAIKAKEAGQ